MILGSLEQSSHAVGHGGAVEIGAQADVIGADEFDDVVDVLDDFFPTDVGELAFGLEFLELALSGLCRCRRNRRRILS